MVTLPPSESGVREICFIPVTHILTREDGLTALLAERWSATFVGCSEMPMGSRDHGQSTAVRVLQSLIFVKRARWRAGRFALWARRRREATAHSNCHRRAAAMFFHRHG